MVSQGPRINNRIFLSRAAECWIRISGASVTSGKLASTELQYSPDVREQVRGLML